MKITNIDKNISSCFMTTALMLIAVEPVIKEDWLSYVNSTAILALLALALIQRNDTSETGVKRLFATVEDDAKDNIYNIVICITGMIIARSEGSKMLYAWILLFSMYFLMILLKAHDRLKKKNKQPQQDHTILSKEYGEPEQRDKYDNGK